jgi:hypothetical protein
METLIAEYGGQLLAVGILGALIYAGWRRMNREEPEPAPVDRCGPGCICGGENLRARQQIVIYGQQPQPNYQQQPQVIYVQVPPQQIAPAQAPQVIYLQAPPQPQPQYLPAPQDQRQVRYLPAPQTAYQPEPPIYAPQHHPQQAPQSYYAGPEPYFEEYQPEYQQPQPARQIPPARVQYLPPAPVSPANEVRRRLEDWELEKELQRRRR